MSSIGRTGASPGSDDAFAVVGGWWCSGLRDVSSDLSALDSEGFWVVVAPFDASPLCLRFESVRPAGDLAELCSGQWSGPSADSWTTSLHQQEFCAAVEQIRSSIAAGDVYQVNLTRRMSAALTEEPDLFALAAVLARHNPAPHSATVLAPTLGLAITSASPERFLRRDGRTVRSSPIKGTAPEPDGFLPKDFAENIMIVDLVRNDLGRVGEWGSVTVPELLAVEAHPGLVHLVSTVEATTRHDVGWPELFEACFPPGSVTGAPKVAAIEHIERLEPVPRGPYCGAIGWVDADRTVGELNVAIRTFWVEDDLLHFGTGGGITYDSDPLGEWRETELKAHRLVSLASGAASDALERPPGDRALQR